MEKPWTMSPSWSSFVINAFFLCFCLIIVALVTFTSSFLGWVLVEPGRQGRFISSGLSPLRSNDSTPAARRPSWGCAHSRSRSLRDRRRQTDASPWLLDYDRLEKRGRCSATVTSCCILILGIAMPRRLSGCVLFDTRSI